MALLITSIVFFIISGMILCVALIIIGIFAVENPDRKRVQREYCRRYVKNGVTVDGVDYVLVEKK